MPGQNEERRPESPRRDPEIAGDEELSIPHANGRILVRPQKVARANEKSPRETMEVSPRSRAGRIGGMGSLKAVCEECCMATFFPDGMPPMWELEDRMRGRMILGRNTPVIAMPPRSVEVCFACGGYTIVGLFIREDNQFTPAPTS